MSGRDVRETALAQELGAETTEGVDRTDYSSNARTSPWVVAYDTIAADTSPE
jgi:hypothetical protein